MQTVTFAGSAKRGRAAYVLLRYIVTVNRASHRARKGIDRLFSYYGVRFRTISLTFSNFINYLFVFVQTFLFASVLAGLAGSVVLCWCAGVPVCRSVCPFTGSPRRTRTEQEAVVAGAAMANKINNYLQHQQFNVFEMEAASMRNCLSLAALVFVTCGVGGWHFQF